MKNKTWNVIGACAAIVLVITLIVGVLPAKQNSEPLDTSTNKPDASTNVTSGTDSNPGDSVVPGEDWEPDFSNSHQLKSVFVNAAEQAAWTNQSDSFTPDWVYNKGSLYRVALPPSFNLPKGERIIFELNGGLQTRVHGRNWVGDLNLDPDEFNCLYTGTTMYNFKLEDGSSIGESDLENLLEIYSVSEIQRNLQNENITNFYLNDLIAKLVLPGSFKESSVGNYMDWRCDYNSNENDYAHNRISMRYPASVPYDIRVSWPEGNYDDYEYLLLLFDDLNSFRSHSSVGWTACEDDFVIPANTPFIISLRPYGLKESEIKDEFGWPSLDERLNYGYVYTSQWRDYVSFEIVK